MPPQIVSCFRPQIEQQVQYAQVGNKVMAVGKYLGIRFEMPDVEFRGRRVLRHNCLTKIEQISRVFLIRFG